MQFKLQTSLLAAILATTALGAAIEPTLTATEPAVPAPTGESENFSAAASNLITVCKDYDFKGCTNFSGTEGTCYNLPGEWNDAVSSVRAWLGHYCYIYQDSACGGFRGGPVQDDNAHNNLGKQGWNDVTSSFVCFLK